MSSRQGPWLYGRAALVFAATAAVACAFLITVPVRNLAAEYFYYKAFDVIEDTGGEGEDVVDVSIKNLRLFGDGLGYIGTASRLRPKSTLYLRKTAEIYFRIGKWKETMIALGEPLPPVREAALMDAPYAKAVELIKKAVALEPLNHSLHLALGKVLDAAGDRAGAVTEFERAARASPHNTSLRYLIARHYLNSGRPGLAVAHARELAAMDVSYLLPALVQSAATPPRLTPALVSRVYKTYLFGAIEIAWRVSRDPDVVRDVAPDNPAADFVVELFFEWRGIEP